MSAVDDVAGGPLQRVVLRVGAAAWALVGVVIAVGIAVTALATVSSVVLPLIFAAVLAVLFRPAAAWLEQRGMNPALAAGLVVLGLVLVVTVVVVLTVNGVIDQTARIGDQISEALDEAGLDADTAAEIRDGLEEVSPAVTEGFVKVLVSGVSTIGGLAAGALLGVLIMYYLVKDARSMQRTVVGVASPAGRARLAAVLDDACLVLRAYGRGRTVLSAIVAFAVGAAGVVLGLPLVLTLVVVNFIGGYVPYIGAVVGGGLAVVVALADAGVPAAIVMLAVVLGANLLLENLVEPKVMGRSLDLHPLLVLVVTAIGGIVGGLVGLMLAVPFTAIGLRIAGRLRSPELLQEIADRARPTVQSFLGTQPASVVVAPDPERHSKDETTSPPPG